MKLLLTIAVRYLVARFRQSLFTIGGIALGVVALTVIQAIMGGFRTEFVKKTLDAAPHVTVRRKPLEPFDPTSPTRAALRQLGDPLIVQVPRPPLPREEEAIRSPSAFLEKVRRVPGVTAAAPVAGGQVMLGLAGNWEPVTLNGVVPSLHAQVLDFESKLQGGSGRDLEGNQNGIILGYFLAERMRANVGDRVTALGADGTPVSLRVVALYNSQVFDVDNANVWVNLRRAQALIGLDGTINAVQVRTHDYNQADAVARRIETAVGLDAESWMEASRNNLNLITMFSSIMYLVVALTMTVAGFGIAGNLITTVSEKTFDIGVLKAMGMRAGQLSLVFVLLSVMLMGIGVIVGLLASYGAVEVISRLPSAARPQPGVLVASETMPVLKDWTIYAVSGVFAMGISVFAGLSPAMRASRLEPLTIIRNAAG
jgi:lipoprotein-releasing system permease protein